MLILLPGRTENKSKSRLSFYHPLIEVSRRKYQIWWKKVHPKLNIVENL